MKKHFISFTFFLIFLIISSGIVFPAGPITHGYINYKLVNDSTWQGPIADVIRSNLAYYDACFIATDITVWYYYTHFSRYEATHGWSFQEEMMKTSANEKELACAYGIAAHLIQDAIFHNEYVPSKIREAYTPNFPYHPIAEATIEVWIIKNEPEIYERYRRALDVLLKDEVLLKKFETAASKRGVINARELVSTLNEVLGNPEGFYTKYFALPEIYKTVAKGDSFLGLLLALCGFIIFYFKVYKERSYIQLLTSFIFIIFGIFFARGGLAGMTDVSDANYYVNRAYLLTREVFTPSGWAERYKYDPTGWGALQRADKDVIWLWIMIIFAVISFVLFYIFKLKKTDIKNIYKILKIERK